MTTGLEERVERLEAECRAFADREAIRHVIFRYCQAADRCDLDLLKSCYHEDAFDDHGFFAGNAHDFAEFVVPLLEQADSSMHAITNIQIDLQESRAACQSQWSVVHRLRHEVGFTDFWHQGRYLDIFEKREGDWKILHRVIASDFDRWVETIDIRAAMGSTAASNMPLTGRRGKGDPGYLGFDLLSHRPTRPPLHDFWSGYAALAEAARRR